MPRKREMPRKIVCPNCEKPSFSFWRKQTLGPARAISCNLCGARVSVGWIYFVPVLLLVAAFPFFVTVLLHEYGLAATGGVVALILIISGIYQHYLVPLIVRSQPANE